jgi:hypothetical protein
MDEEEGASDYWCVFGEFDSEASARVVRSLLEAEGVKCSINLVGLELGIPSKFRVIVPESKLHRARWIIDKSDITDRELDFLATGTWKHED